MSGEQETVIPEKVLKHALANQYEVHPKDVKISSSEVSAGSAKGDNYACIMKKAVVESEIRGDLHKDSLIIKLYPSAAYWLEMLKQGCMFRTEVMCYKDIFPKLNAIAEKNGIDPIKFPICYYGDEEEGYLVMENLKEQGFIIEDKTKGLDLPHMKMVLDQLAKIHALSYKWIENYFGGLERFKKDYWTCNGEGWILSENGSFEKMTDQMFDSIFNMFYEVLGFHSEGTDLLERVKDFSKNRRAKVDPVHLPKGKFNCLIHNDAWCNNFMFKDNADGSPKDIRVIDLQLCRRARPSVDLAYCFGSSLTPIMREKHTDELLAHYHNSLSSLLAQLGYKEDLYTLSDLQADYKDSFPFAFCMSSMHSQIQLTDPYAEGNFDVDNMTSEEATKKSMEGMLEFQKKQAQTNKPLVERMIQLAVEAKRMEVI